jgi:prepilin-type N-terminal cleavage/methylation domain-containing protein
MKIFGAMSKVEGRASRAKGFRAEIFRPRLSTLVSRPSSAFTLIEIALCLAVIGIALTAIIAVLPLGMDVQRENREATVINQDATIFMEAIRNGARGADDLTNYVYEVQVGIDNNQTFLAPFTSGAQIIGLLTTPNSTNHAYARSISGPAVEKPPQNNQIIQQDSFGYRLVCENIPVESASPPNVLQGNLHELRLTFLWPTLSPLTNSPVGNGRQTFRALVAGQIQTSIVGGQTNYFFQSQSFANTNAP